MIICYGSREINGGYYEKLEKGVFNMNLDKFKKVFSTVVLVATAVSAFANVFDQDRKDKELEALKKTVAELKEK